MTPSFEEFVQFAEDLADAARRQTLPRFRARAAVDNKSAAAFDPVTEADREAERVMRREIAARFHDHGVIGEEFGAEQSDAAWRWVLDPVDGTRAFICGVATWATLIALEESGAPRLGVIDQPYLGERWIGHAGTTVFRSGDAETLCQTRDVRRLREARVSTTDPRAGAYFTEDEARAFHALAADARVARFSLDAYAYGLLALGELDLVIEAGLKHHDYAALVPVVEGAGGVVTGWDGAPVGRCPRGRIIAAATPDLHAEAAALLHQALSAPSAAS